MNFTLTENKEKKLYKELFGIFLEDINYGVDGGLYAELLENRNFEAIETLGGPPWHTYHPSYDGMYAWSDLCTDTDSAASRMFIETRKPLNHVNPHHLRYKAEKAGQGFANKAYLGIYLKKNEQYVISFFAKLSEKEMNEPVNIKAFVTSDGKEAVCAEFTVDTNDWKKYEMTVTAACDAKAELFKVCFEGAGDLCFDWMSLKPADAVCGVFRKDIFDALAELQPEFVRFPGGCVVEGNTLENRYKWKESVGPCESRRNNWNRWAVHESGEDNGWRSRDSHYNQTLGIGFYEYFLLCEKLGAIPLPIMNVGMACQYQSEESVPVESGEFHQFIQDVLDLVEFANGDENTLWGSLRASMGHKEPFGLKYVGIGNEQWQTRHEDFFTRYKIFEKRIHAVYPDLKLLGTAGPDVTSEHYTKAWDYYQEEISRKSDFVYAVDEHYYMPPAHFFEKNDFYDKYKRTGIKVFAGEYAAHTDYGVNNWETALAEAAFLTGIERNSDLVCFAAYAPLFGRKYYNEWRPDLIWFDEENVYRTPNYYVQEIFSKYHGNRLVDMKADGDRGPVDCVTTMTEENGHGAYFVKIVNKSAEEQKVVLSFDEEREFTLSEKVTLSCKDLKAVNDGHTTGSDIMRKNGGKYPFETVDATENIAPVFEKSDVKIEKTHEVIIPGYSFVNFVFRF